MGSHNPHRGLGGVMVLQGGNLAPPEVRRGKFNLRKWFCTNCIILSGEEKDENVDDVKAMDSQKLYGF